VAAQAAGGGDEALGVLLEQLPVHPRLVVVALHEGEARELDEVLVTGLVLGQQREVVVELLAALGVATGVVDASPAGRPFAAMVVGHVGLGADDRLDPLLVALAVEVERAVHVAVIGDADRRLAVPDGLGDEFVEPRRAVEHREFGVDMEVGEGIGHGLLTRRMVGWKPRKLQGCGSNVAESAERVHRQCAHLGSFRPRPRTNRFVPAPTPNEPSADHR